MNGNQFGEFLLIGIAVLLLWTARSVRHGNLVVFIALIGLMEGHLWLHGQQAFIPARHFQVFAAALIGLVALHKYHTYSKLIVIAIGAGIMTGLFVYEHRWQGWWEHFMGIEKHANERRHILVNLAFLLPGFAMVAYYFEHSGACGWIERHIRSNLGILFMLAALSGVLDNIASAMLGGSIIMARYGSIIRHCRERKRKLPRWLFLLLVGVIASSNLGGAPSFIGDTTTVMIYLSGVGILVLAKGYVAALVGQLALCKLMVRSNKRLPDDYDHTQAERQEYVDWTVWQLLEGILYGLSLLVFPARWGKLVALLVSGRKLYPLLGILGLVVGNALFDQPAAGLWAGLLVGLLLAKLLDSAYKTKGTSFSWTELWHAVPNTLFLILLVYAAKLLPLGHLVPILMQLSHDQVAILLGLLSPVFDNIPLTSLALDIGGFDWALLALTVGFGGSLLWFGSSAGIALAKQFPELENTTDWFPRAFLVLFSVLWLVIGVHFLVWKWLPALLV